MFIELHLLPDEENEVGRSIFVNLENIVFVEEASYDDEFPETCKIVVTQKLLYWFFVQESYDTVKRLIREAMESVRNK